MFADTRTWDVVPDSIPAHAGLSLPPQATATLARILLETGLALTPARSIWNPAAWFAVLRYADSFATQQRRLRLVPGADRWEARLLTILAEEVSVGMGMVVARDHLGVRHAADVLPLIEAGEVGYRAPPVDPKHPEVRPDYLCLDDHEEALFVEMKGSVGTRSAISRGLSDGKDQVTNVEMLRHRPRRRAGVVVADRLVIASHLCIEGRHPNSETATVVKDPPVVQPEHDDGGRASDLAVRLSYAKAFNFADAPVVSRNLLTGSRVNPGLPPPAELGGWRFQPVGPCPFGGWIGVEVGVWEALVASGRGDLSEALRRPLANVSDLLRKNWAESDLPAWVLLNNGVALVGGP